jgi:hypothetical protein
MTSPASFHAKSAREVSSVGVVINPIADAFVPKVETE